ncbi:hypothetical protein BZZ01_13265 [Nostocales cyanobacterium HT-58-2]|nr:hypothetical protein BZZ01_13265 [Nostocales cyanobacterium HT-58-2]
MYLLRFSIYLVPIALTIVASNFIHHTIAKARTNIQKLQLSAVKFSEVKKPAANLSQVRRIPSVKFPKNTYPAVKLPDIKSPQIQIQENKYLTIITLPTDLLFDHHDKDMIRPDAENMLRQVSQTINKYYPDTWLQILGHTDSQGSQNDNLKLSEQRVAAVQRWLSEKGGIAISLMSKEGYGEAQPIAPNQKSDCSDNPLGQQKNRRIEIVIQKLVNNQV